MPDYKKMYLHLFNRVTDALNDIQAGAVDHAQDNLKQAQQECEELFIETDSDTDFPAKC